MRQPVNMGRPPCTTRSGSVGNPACGDVLTFHICIEDDHIQSVGFESMGSAYGLAAADVLCDRVEGMAVKEALACDADCVLTSLPDLPQRHRYLARLAIDALRAALRHEPAAATRATSAVDVDGARSFIRRILGNGQAWTTAQVVAMAEAEAIQLPDAPARFLANMAQEGLIQSAMDVERGAMTWRL